MDVLFAGGRLFRDALEQLWVVYGNASVALPVDNNRCFGTGQAAGAM